MQTSEAGDDYWQFVTRFDAAHKISLVALCTILFLECCKKHEKLAYFGFANHRQDDSQSAQF
jgi:hypothetical protein